nr:queuosine precursor transporter [uncultured Draconibacterium sp.]
MRDNKNNLLPLILLSSILGGALVGALAVASKLIVAYGLTASVTFLAYAFSFTITDIAGEIYGKKVANQVAFGGFIAVIIGMIIFQIAIFIPGAPFWNNEEGFNNVFGLTARVTLAGVLSYGASQFLDVYLFHKIKEITHDKFLWLRNNLSTAISQFIDTLIFITIGFGFSLNMVAGQYILKIGVAAFDTIIVYAVVWLLRKYRNTTIS